MNMDHPVESTAGTNPALKRTTLFVVAGVLLLAFGWWVQPRFKPAEVKSAEERVLFPELTDAQKAASLEIIRYDEDLAALYPFKVVKTGGVWVLPSHQNYPADAKDHLAAAATELVDLKALDVVSTSALDHETYGVIEPDQEKIEPGMTGIGSLVEIRDASGSKLARLVIGKEDKQPGPAGGGRLLRFVRRAGQDPVYRVEIDTSKFTTKFGDWIEKDLLKLTPWDVRQVEIDDYTLAAVEVAGRMEVRMKRNERLELAYNDKESSWTLTTMEVFPEQGGADAKPEVRGLQEGEEVDSTSLNDLRNALGDLQIIEVSRKPSGLSADLRAEESFTGDREAVTSLQQRGFLPLPSGEILSTEGQTVIGMKDGVEYVLRFGAGTTVDKAGSDEAAADAGLGGETSARYLLVMSRFNENLLEKPDLAELPALPEEGQDTAVVDPEAEADSEDAAEPEQSSAAEAEKAGAESEATPVDKESQENEPAAEPTAAELLKQADEAEAAMQKAIEARRRVERENRRLQEAYDEKVATGQKRVRELNARFADWYYIVSEEEFNKIHLSGKSVIKAVAAPAEEQPPAAPGN